MYDLAIIGLGSAGLEAASIAVKNGLKVIAFEQKDLGGTCLNLGCIPTKSIFHCAAFYNDIKKSADLGINCTLGSYNWNKVLDRKNNIVSKFKKVLDSTLSKNITLIKSAAELVVNDNEVIISANDNIYSAKNIIVATGSKPVELPNLPFDSKFIINSDDIYNLQELPKKITIVGSGAIGIEWATIFSYFDIQVNIIEKAHSLAPLFDIDIQKRLERIFKLNNIKFYKNDYIVSVDNNTITLNSGTKLETDLILSAVGRKPIYPKVSINGCSENFRLIIDKNFSLDFDNIYIVGDASATSSLAHGASFQAAEIINKILFDRPIRNKIIPSAIYIKPQIASIGINEQDIADTSLYKINKVLVSSVAKFWCDEAQDGFVKVIIKDNKIKGAHIVSENASDLIMLFEIFIEKEMEVNEINDFIFPHPSYSEIVKEVLKN